MSPDVKKAIRYTHKCLNDGLVHYRLKKMAKYRGLLTIGDEMTVDIDPRHEIIPTLIHECIHAMETEMPEEEVLALETKVVSQMTSRISTNLLKKLAKCL